MSTMSDPDVEFIENLLFAAAEGECYFNEERAPDPESYDAMFESSRRLFDGMEAPPIPTFRGEYNGSHDDVEDAVDSLGDSEIPFVLLTCKPTSAGEPRCLSAFVPPGTEMWFANTLHAIADTIEKNYLKNKPRED